MIKKYSKLMRICSEIPTGKYQVIRYIEGKEPEILFASNSELAANDFMVKFELDVYGIEQGYYRKPLPANVKMRLVNTENVKKTLPDKPTITDKDEFVGYHAQRKPRSVEDDKFIEGYGKDYLSSVLEALPSKDRSIAQNRGWLSYDWSNPYAEGYEKKEEIVVDWLNKKGYRWIFVSESRLLGDYGNFFYKIYFNLENIIDTIPDINVDDAATIYLYKLPTRPKAIRVKKEDVGND
jgi:hypothetical protein